MWITCPPLVWYTCCQQRLCCRAARLLCVHPRADRRSYRCSSTIAGVSHAAVLSCPLAVYTAANISGGHLNPAVTISTLLCGFYPLMHSILYIILQVGPSLRGREGQEPLPKGVFAAGSINMHCSAGTLSLPPTADCLVFSNHTHIWHQSELTQSCETRGVIAACTRQHPSTGCRVSAMLSALCGNSCRLLVPSLAPCWPLGCCPASTWAWATADLVSTQPAAGHTLRCQATHRSSNTCKHSLQQACNTRVQYLF